MTTTHNDPSGTKKAKQRVTINVCSNAGGAPIKLSVLFTSKAKHSRCFHGIDKSTLTVVCIKGRKNAWVITVMFNNCFQNCFARNVKKKLTLGQEQKRTLAAR